MLGLPDASSFYLTKGRVFLLQTGHAKLWSGGSRSAPFVARQQGIEIKYVLTVQEADLAHACNPYSDRGLLERLRQALDSYRKEVPLVP